MFNWNHVSHMCTCKIFSSCLKVKTLRKNGQQKHEKMLKTANYYRKQIKTTVRYHFTPVRWPSSKSLQTINAGDSMRKGNSPTLLVGMKIGAAIMENSIKVL